MKQVAIAFVFCILLLAISSCSFTKKERRIKSPCIRLNSNTPCKSYPVNDWWMK
ncbi:putative lipoprotein [Candidatus Neoehrlichia lotoris str. RAC413]|uniref:Putative lipoprotein n=1 Tax=Candidatus Neoehrlichia procyonis str. RAC413 TaxID=1359163 RepID=A0A0F3NRV2_9RICK|nr:putative lipoprotein [Candidatus Neoehrlichia lotoris str. RAC413]